MTADPQIAEMLRHEYAMRHSEITALTDDLAPVEYYNSFALNIHSRAGGQ